MSDEEKIIELVEDELRDLWQRGYDQEPSEEAVRPHLDAIMRHVSARWRDAEEEHICSLNRAMDGTCFVCDSHPLPQPPKGEE